MKTLLTVLFTVFCFVSHASLFSSEELLSSMQKDLTKSNFDFDKCIIRIDESKRESFFKKLIECSENYSKNSFISFCKSESQYLIAQLKPDIEKANFEEIQLNSDLSFLKQAKKDQAIKVGRNVHAKVQAFKDTEPLLKKLTRIISQVYHSESEEEQEYLKAHLSFGKIVSDEQAVRITQNLLKGFICPKVGTHSISI